MDASAVMSFAKMAQLAEAQGFVVVFTHLSPEMQEQLEKEVCTAGEGSACRVFPDLDHGVEWCEEQMIETFESVGLAARKPTPIMRQLEEFLSASPRFAGWQEFLVPEKENPPEAPDAIQSSMSFMERLEVEAGQVMIRQGQSSPGLYFIESGQVTIQVEAEGQRTLRLRTRGEGTIVGEMGLYLGSPASASVVVDQSGTVYHLSVENLERLEAEQPELAGALHKFLARHLSERLSSTAQTLQALLD